MSEAPAAAAASTDKQAGVGHITRLSDIFSADEEVRGAVLKALIAFARDTSMRGDEVTAPALDRMVELLRESPVENERALVAEALSNLADKHDMARRIVEARTVSACVQNLRRQDAPERTTYWNMRMIYEAAWSEAGLHPEITSGVLLSSVLDAIIAESASERVRRDGAHLVRALWIGFRDAPTRPQIPAPAAAAVVAASKASNIGSASAAAAQPLSPMARLDSDSLALCFSFLCGCDWFRAMRTCRRWVGLRFKPASWPSAIPCGNHMPKIVQAFTALLNDDATAAAGCVGLSRMDANGTRLFLATGALARVVELLQKKEDTKTPHAALMLCNMMCYADDGAYASRMADGGVLPELLRLIHSPHKEIASKATTVLGNTCYGNPAQITRVMEAGAVPIIMKYIRERPVDQLVEHPAAALACMAFRGTDLHRRVLLREGYLPQMALYIVRYCARGAAKTVRNRDSGEPRYIVDLLSAMSFMLRTAALDAPPSGMNSLCSLVARECGPRSTFDSMLDHWSERVRDAVTKFQREFYDETA